MIRKAVFIVFSLAISLGLARAQSNYASVSGSVLDPEHRPIPGTHVHITARETGAQRDVVSNATGLYEISGLQPGSYTLTVDSTGFRQAMEAITLEVGQQATLDVQLQLGTEAQTVTVEAAGVLIKSQDASVGEVVE